MEGDAPPVNSINVPDEILNSVTFIHPSFTTSGSFVNELINHVGLSTAWLVQVSYPQTFFNDDPHGCRCGIQDVGGDEPASSIVHVNYGRSTSFSSAASSRIRSGMKSPGNSDAE
jgi:hypothetical protein